MKIKRHSRGKVKAFTLLEVLLVIAILALMAAFVVPNLIGAGEEAKIGLAAAAVGPTGVIAERLDKYRFDVGIYPTTDEGLGALTERPDSVTEESAKWKGPYIRDADKMKDPWGNAYQYKSPGDVNAEFYDLWSMGPDSEDGTDDDITNWRKEGK